MERQELLNHLNHVFKCEYNIYQLDQINEKINTLRKKELAAPDKSYCRRDPLIYFFFIWLIRLVIPVFILILLGVFDEPTLSTLPYSNEIKNVLLFLESNIYTPVVDYLFKDHPNSILNPLFRIVYIPIVITLPFALLFGIINWLYDAQYAHKSKKQMKQRVKQHKEEEISNHNYNALLDRYIEKNNTEQAKWKETLNNLYSKGIIKPRYQNLAAVSALQAYIEDEICTRLEGENGAYAQYLKDVRAGRIYESIQQLEHTVSKGLQNVQIEQRTIAQQMYNDSQRRLDLEKNISHSIDNLNNMVTQSKKDNDKLYRSTMNGINDYLHAATDCYRHMDRLL